MKVNKYHFDGSKAILAAIVLREFCNKTPCQKCPFYSAHDCTLRSSAPDAWTEEDWRSPEELTGKEEE